MNKKVREEYPVYLTNSYTRKKEKFEPLTPSFVGLYVCGPTVYGDPHLGHARSAISFDIIRRYFEFLGYKVRHIRNITDVGHLEDELAESGEDKISKKARLEKLEPMEIAQQYTRSYHEAINKLNNLPPSIEPTATGHIPEQISVIKNIIDNGFAYVVNGSVYFDLDKYSKSYEYGKLSGKVLEELQSGSRDTEGLGEKKNPHDFALWKKASPEHIMRWDSPWGVGFPGWHIECTTMCTRYLGETFDIHGGGLDLQFPHHEAEIAQSVGAYHHQPARYWLHNNMITIDGQKMSKSLGNFITLAQLFEGNHPKLEQAYSPMTVRFFILQAHYRSPLDFSNQALQAGEKGFARLMAAEELLDKLQHQEAQVNEQLDREIRELCLSCYEHMSDDFNTAKTIASLFEISSRINAFYHKQQPLESISAESFRMLTETYRGFIHQVLGLQSEKSDEGGRLDALVNLLIDMRTEAKSQKDYATSDKIRDQLAGLGIMLKDEKGGKTTYTLAR
ncbi:MAG: cysteine--tRNA ligase [Cyclobacteriaceae bacterium]